MARVKCRRVMLNGYLGIDMKQYVVAAMQMAVLSLVAVGVACADDNLGAYAGARIGQGNIETTVDLQMFGGQVKTVSSDPEIVGGLFAGYMLHKNWGIEAGFDSLGKYPVGINGIGSVKETVDISALSAAAIGRLPLGNALSATARFGYSYFWTKHSATGVANGSNFSFGVARESERQSSVPYTGLGLDWKLDRSLGVQLNFQHYLDGIDYADNSKLDLDVWTVGVYYQFGR
jgi:hypothetical protein